MAISVSDRFKTTFVIEIAGVATLTKLWWECTAVNGADTLKQTLDSIAAQFWATVDDFLVPQAILSCMRYNNFTTPEKSTVFPGLVGVAAGGSHPQHQALRWNIYGNATEPDPLHINAINLSGVTKNLSTRGRLNVDTLDVGLIDFLKELMTTGITGIDAKPVVRYVPIPLGAPAFADVRWARNNPTFNNLQSRKTALCA